MVDETEGNTSFWTYDVKKKQGRWRIRKSEGRKEIQGFLKEKVLLLIRDSRGMSYETAAILNQNIAYIPHIIG